MGGVLRAAAARFSGILGLSPESVLTYGSGKALLVSQDEGAETIPWLASFDSARQTWQILLDGVQLFEASGAECSPEDLVVELNKVARPWHTCPALGRRKKRDLESDSVVDA
eukprot:3896519-Alexandrium_andersonii.AAC.1